MRLLLDTNIWRYLVDNDYQDSLYKATRKQGMKVVVAPSVVIETLRINDSALRKKIVEVQTRDCWDRLMPDAYLQCEDVKREIIRLHPEWALKDKNTTLFNNLRYDWIRTKGGFWGKARTNAAEVAAHYHSQDAGALEVARLQSQDLRSAVLEQGEKILNGNSLDQIEGTWVTNEGKIVRLDAWRVYALAVWTNMLQSKSAFRQWISCDIDLNLLLNYYTGDFIKFWESEVQATAVPREWLRFAVYALQSERKVTAGNPTDSAIAVHLCDADFLISADKNFVAMANQIKDEAPFKTAHGFLVAAGKDGMNQLFQMFSDQFFMGLKVTSGAS